MRLVLKAIERLGNLGAPDPAGGGGGTNGGKASVESEAQDPAVVAEARELEGDVDRVIPLAQRQLEEDHRRLEAYLSDPSRRFTEKEREESQFLLRAKGLQIDRVRKGRAKLASVQSPRAMAEWKREFARDLDSVQSNVRD